MITTPTPVPGVLVVEVRAFADARGYFMETYRRERYAEAGIDRVFVQDNLSRSCRSTLRGLHYQLHDPQGKLVQAVRGAVWDVAVDIRVGSPHFGRWYGTVLSDENHRQLWIPEGFAHGFVALSDTADVMYKVTRPYDPKDERGLLWNDETLAIAWPLGGAAPLLSTRDAAAPRVEGNPDLPRYA